jgi:chemotaxis protein MotA
MMMTAQKNHTPGVMGSTVLGLAGALVLMGFVGLESGGGSLWNPIGAAIVMGGVAVSALLAFRFSELTAALRAAGSIFRNDDSIQRDITQLVEFARRRQKSQVREAEALLAGVVSPFLRLGLQLVADDAPINDILHVMNWRIQKLLEHEALVAKLFRTLAGLAPAFGLLATLVGLIGLMAGLGTASVTQVGEQMSVALVATLYGVVLANVVFKPIAIKLEQRAARRVGRLNVLLEGVLLVRLGRSPTMIADAMTEFLRERTDELHGAS